MDPVILGSPGLIVVFAFRFAVHNAISAATSDQEDPLIREASGHVEALFVVMYKDPTGYKPDSMVFIADVMFAGVAFALSCV